MKRHGGKRERSLAEESPEDEETSQKAHVAELAFRPISSSTTGIKKNEGGHRWKELKQTY